MAVWAERWKWIIGVLLLAVAFWMNVRNLLPDHTSISPIPLPKVELSQAELSAVKPAVGPLFRRVEPQESGLTYTHRIDTGHPLKCLYFSGFASGGVAIGDFDRDGLQDIFLAGGPAGNCLYRQVSAWKFEDVTGPAGVRAEQQWCSGATMLDINNDGHLDLYVCCYDDPNLLYVNRGDGTFREESYRYGLNLTDASMSAAFCDYDRDGDLDLYLLTYRFENAAGWPALPPVVQQQGKRVIQPGLERFYEVTDDAHGYGPVGRADGLMRNNGDGTFTNVSNAANIKGSGHGLSATWWDFDQDGWPDLYVANDFYDPDRLYRNNQDGTFTNVLTEHVPYTAWFSMGAAAADLDNDGGTELVVADMSATTHFKQKVNMGGMSDHRDFLENAVPRQTMRNVLYRPSGKGRFQELARLAGIASSDWTWSVKAHDWDNDGLVDLFFSNGSARVFTDADIPFESSMLPGKTTWDLYEQQASLPEKNLLFRNHGDDRFENMGPASGFDRPTVSMASAAGDLDGDGDLDLVVANLDEPVSLFENTSEANRLVLRLVGTQSNRFGWGATVRIHAGGQTQLRTLMPVSGFLGCDQPEVFFGLGTHRKAERVSIEWPSGIHQVFHNLEAGCRYTVLEGGEVVADNQTVEVEPKFQLSEILSAARHRQRDFDDFGQQPLLPFRLSRYGPCLAWADFDDDGDEDLFLGGAAGTAGQLWRNDGVDGFVQSQVDAFQGDVECEDSSAVWFDVELDGDLDLYVVSGGVENQGQDVLLHDRLYLNHGNRGFLRARSEQISAESQCGGACCVADMDHDGDLDLFVGGRYLPGQYPLPERNRLLRNDDGTLVDVTESWAPTLRSTGMVTGALWSDVNADGWLDLLLTHAWGPVELFMCRKGRFERETENWGLRERTGWWQGITGADIDQDGDVDYLLTNMGLNTKYHASPEQPYRIFYGDMFGTDRACIVEAEYEGGVLYPARGRSCSTKAMPSLGQRFPTYRDFASAPLEKIYGQQPLAASYECGATCFESGVLLNEGDRFAWKAFPRMAQVAPAFGVVVGYFDADQHLDVVIAQNFFSPQPESGRFSGGLGQLLTGSGKGDFTCVDPKDSGIVIPEDAKSLTLVDLDQQHGLDLVVGINNGPIKTFVSRVSLPRNIIMLRLIGNRGNTSAVGSRVEVLQDSHVLSATELYAGGGYRSQSPTTLAVALPRNGPSVLRVRWPDGRVTQQEVDGKEAREEVTVRAP